MKISVIILAAGKGKRMQSSIPKVLHQVGGKTLLEHVVDAAHHGIQADNIYVVYGHHGETIRQRLNHLPVTWVEQKEQLGTAHAVAQPLNQIPDDHLIIVLYGDVPLIANRTIETLVKATPKDGLSLLVANVKDPYGLGRIIRNENHLFEGIVEERDASEEQRRITEIFTGILAIQAGLLKNYLQQVDNKNSQQEYYLTDVPSIASVAGSPITTVTASHPEQVLGINDKQQLAKTERFYQLRKAEALMAKGAIFRDPSRIDVRGNTKIGLDTVIDINTVFEGEVQIGDNCLIGPNCIIRNSKLGNNITIKANSIVEDSIVEDHCIIGPFARIRPNTHLQQSAQVGNFVEIKKSTIGKASKISHLSYVGDSTVGQQVNIGAGTITCNYDGVNKHQTIIKDKAFVGSNSSLVAPVEIGEGVTIGAGSTITENVPEGSLTLGRARQKTLKDWQRPQKQEDK